MWDYKDVAKQGDTQHDYRITINTTEVARCDIEGIAQEIRDGMNVIEILREHVHIGDLPDWLLNILREKRLTAW